MKLGGLGPWSEAALGVLAVLPLLALAVVLIVALNIPWELRWLWLALALVWLLTWLWFAISRRTRRLQLLSSLLQSLREGDYSLRARSRGAAFREVWREFNALAERLGSVQRRGLETDALLVQLLAALDFAVLVLDERGRLVEMNPAAEQLLGDVATVLIGRSARELKLADWLARTTPFTDSRDFASGTGPWEVRSLTFRRRGQPHRLLVVTDVSHSLREEERRAWRRLIRVLGHEINNSLGPIQSTANLLKERHAAARKSGAIDASLGEGLDLIERRSQALGSFIRRYAELARLPPPNPETLELAPLLRHVASLENRVAVALETESSMNVRADRAQLEQALINLVRNAADAALENGGGVRVRWKLKGRHAVIEVEDDGPGIAHADNLFVPFFTTKPGGSGIGLVLARQIIEAHGGNLRLANRRNAQGTLASIRLPA